MKMRSWLVITGTDLHTSLVIAATPTSAAKKACGTMQGAHWEEVAEFPKWAIRKAICLSSGDDYPVLVALVEHG